MSEKEPGNPESPIRGFLGEFGRSILQGIKESLGVALVGAVIGAAVLGGFGAKYFGWSGFGIGLAAGAVIGGLVFWWLYASAI